MVDANYFPGYKGVPDAGTLIGEYIDQHARRLERGGLAAAA